MVLGIRPLWSFSPDGAKTSLAAHLYAHENKATCQRVFCGAISRIFEQVSVGSANRQWGVLLTAALVGEQDNAGDMMQSPMAPEEKPAPIDLSADRPSTDPREDSLGYAPFAKRLAEGMLNLKVANGQVLALHGPWGFGKTTFLNYVQYYLTRQPPPNTPLIVQFNPWWFSGGEDLIRAFFGQLQAHMEGHTEFAPEIRERLANLAEIVGDIPLPHTWLAKAFGRIVRPVPKDVAKLKKEISAALREQPHRIIVVIDDIDRLTSEEIRQVFRCVKAVADFPNVIYLMAFDRLVVTRSLEKLQGGSGEDYLEKIVQVPFELPLVDRLAIRNFFFEKLAPIADFGFEQSDKIRWGNIFFEGIDGFIETPRDAVRFTNALSVTFPAVYGEVNSIDFIAIESLRIFCPDIYGRVRNNRDMFVGYSVPDPRSPIGEAFLKFHKEWQEQLHGSIPEHENAISDLLKRLFPLLEGVFGNRIFGPEWGTSWRRDLRICSEDIFPVYFSLNVALARISNSEMRTILAEANDSRRFGEQVLKLADQVRPDGRTKVSAFLDRLQDFTESDIAIESIESVLFALLDNGDQLVLPDDRSRGFLALGNETQIGRIFWQLLKRIGDRNHRFEIISRCFKSARGLYNLHLEYIVLSQQQGGYGESPHPESEWYVSTEQLAELRQLLAARISAASKDGSLLRAPGLRSLLAMWSETGSANECKAWVVDTLEDDNGLAELLEKFLARSSRQNLGDSVGESFDRLDPHWFKAFIDPEELVVRVRAFAANQSLTPTQKRAVAQFLKEYEFRKGGGNPDSPFFQG